MRDTSGKFCGELGFWWGKNSAKFHFAWFGFWKCRQLIKEDTITSKNKDLFYDNFIFPNLFSLISLGKFNLSLTLLSIS